jgi:hypothetical protein
MDSRYTTTDTIIIINVVECWELMMREHQQPDTLGERQTTDYVWTINSLVTISGAQQNEHHERTLKSLNWFCGHVKVLQCQVLDCG